MSESTEALLEHLREAEFEILGRMPWSSNHTFLVEIDPPPWFEAREGAADDGEEAEGGDEPGEDLSSGFKGIYKPERGERPLWDFPGGLYKREVAAYELCAQLGWDVIPPTVVCGGQHGVGSLQLFVDAEFEQHYFTIQNDDAYRPALEKICVFDLVANNTDRKSGHCLIKPPDEVYGIDNALCFHEDFKLRTVLWEYGGEDIADELLESVERLVEDDITDDLSILLQSNSERAAVIERAQMVLAEGAFPTDPTGRRYPWPLV